MDLADLLPAPTPTPTPEGPPALPISLVEVTGFQSLHDVRLALAPFTVVVGPSSSGKSALTRALRTLVNNGRGSSFVTTGFKKSVLKATTPRGEVTLSRGSAADNAYILTPLDGTAPTKMTKLGGETPEEVREFFGFSLDALHLAAQFDKPYLLDATPQEVARVLADVTNIGAVRDAGREAKRRRLAAGVHLRSRSADLDRLREGLPEAEAARERHATLLALAETLSEVEAKSEAAHNAVLVLGAFRRAALRAEQAEEALAATPSVDKEKILDLRRQATAVEAGRALLERITAAAGRLQAARGQLDRHVEYPADLLDRARAVLRASKTLGEVTAAAQGLQAARTAEKTRESHADELATALADLRQAHKAESPTCPACGQALPEETR